jgi:hypothetical protein
VCLLQSDIDSPCRLRSCRRRIRTAFGREGQGHFSASNMHGAYRTLHPRPSLLSLLSLTGEVLFFDVGQTFKLRAVSRSVPHLPNGCMESVTSDIFDCDNQTASTNVVIFNVTVCLQQSPSIPVLRLCLNLCFTRKSILITFFTADGSEFVQPTHLRLLALQGSGSGCYMHTDWSFVSVS